MYRDDQGLLWQPCGWDSMLPLQGVWVWSLLKELGSHMLGNQKTNKRQKQSRWSDVSLKILPIGKTFLSHCNLQTFLDFMAWTGFSSKGLFKSWSPVSPIPQHVTLFGNKIIADMTSCCCSVTLVSGCLWPHRLQHARPLCPSLSPRVCSDSCTLSWWCYLTILSSATPFSCLQSFPAFGSFPMSWLFTSGGQSIGISVSVLVLLMKIQGWFPLGLTGLTSLLSKWLSSLLQHHNSKALILQHSAFLMVQLSHQCVTTGKIKALTLWASLIAQLVKNLSAMGESLVDSWIGKIRWRWDRLPALVFLDFPCDSAGKESACDMGDLCSIPGLRRSPGEGKGYPLQYSGLENSMDCIVHGVTKSWTRQWLSLSLWIYGPL